MHRKPTRFLKNDCPIYFCNFSASRKVTEITRDIFIILMNRATGKCQSLSLSIFKKIRDFKNKLSNCFTDILYFSNSLYSNTISICNFFNKSVKFSFLRMILDNLPLRINRAKKGVYQFIDSDYFMCKNMLHNHPSGSFLLQKHYNFIKAVLFSQIQSRLSIRIFYFKVDSILFKKFDNV